VLDQAVRIMSGEAPPARCPYLAIDGGVPYLQSMPVIAERYLDRAMRKQLGCDALGPHKSNPRVWGTRPLPPTCLQYAANDVHTIKAMLGAGRCPMSYVSYI
jgi:hypothetical protein